MNQPKQHRVVILGGGFGGLHAARSLRNAPVEVTLIDRHNYHLFQPLLYQVATGELSPANIASPLRVLLRRQSNCRVWMGNAIDFNVVQQRVILQDGDLEYDTLIVATGAGTGYFGNDEWAQHAPGLKSIEDATTIRRRILYAFEAAEREKDPQRRTAWLTFVIVGGGPTGVEMAGAISEIARYSFRHDFRNIRTEHARIILVEAGQSPLGHYPERLTKKAVRALERLNVTLRLRSKVTDIQADHVWVQSGDQHEQIDTRTVVWAAGVAATPLGRRLADATGIELDRIGRIEVAPDLSIPGQENIFVIGDLANAKDEAGAPLPGLAPVAMQEGKFVADQLVRQLQGREVESHFRYRDRGSMAVIGRYSAVAMIGKYQLSGIPAWFIWLFIHLLEITQFRNRLLVMVQWGWTFFTRDRATRLITEQQTSGPDNVDLPLSDSDSFEH